MVAQQTLALARLVIMASAQQLQEPKTATPVLVRCQLMLLIGVTLPDLLIMLSTLIQLPILPLNVNLNATLTFPGTVQLV